MRLVIISLFFLASGCVQQKNKSFYAVNAAAKELNDSAVYVALQFHEYARAVELLDRATQIDSNFFEAYKNKMTFQGLVHPFDPDKVLGILKSLNRLRPLDPEYYMHIGMLYYKKGDSLTSLGYFNDALLHFNSILDTMRATTPGYDVFVMSKANTLFFQRQDQKARGLLMKLYETTRDSVTKEMISLSLHKTSEDVIADFMALSLD